LGSSLGLFLSSYYLSLKAWSSAIFLASKAYLSLSYWAVISTRFYSSCFSCYFMSLLALRACTLRASSSLARASSSSFILASKSLCTYSAFLARNFKSASFCFSLACLCSSSCWEARIACLIISSSSSTMVFTDSCILADSSRALRIISSSSRATADWAKPGVGCCLPSAYSLPSTCFRASSLNSWFFLIIILLKEEKSSTARICCTSL